MKLMRWREGRGDSRSENSGLARVRNEVDDVFDRFFGSWNGNGDWRDGGFSPRLDISETEDAISIRAELPGVKPEDIDINVLDNSLTLRGEKSCGREEEEKNYRYCESEFGSFARTIQLPTGVDPDKVDAEYKDGVVTIRLTKRPEAKPRRIAVRGTTPAQSSPQVTTRAQDRDERSGAPF